MQEDIHVQRDLRATITGRITAAEQGTDSGAQALFAALYSELRRLSRHELARHGYGVSLGVTTLLHETYVNMAARSGPTFPDRGRFMAYAARVMRGLIIDHIRNRHALKRGGGFELTSFEVEVDSDVVDEREISEISDALDALSKTDPPLSEIVDLKFFCGFSFAEIAAMRGISERTVQRMWAKARLYLYRSVRAIFASE